ncbi:SIR2 family NAD-dependent protein deacylase [Herbidospora sp. RD11066]
MEEHDWERLVRQLGKGACTPFLGAGASADVLPMAAKLSEELADEWDYPHADRDVLINVAQHGVIKFGESATVKEQICERLRGIGPPNLSKRHEPYKLLSSLPIPVYMTTNYDDLILQSLRTAGKSPNVALCPWNSGIEYDRALFDDHAGWDPAPEAPLVYHLHGRWEEPSSIVVCEDDYHEFIFNLALDRGTESSKMLPPAIFEALTARTLLFIGYSMRDSTFRFMFDSLLRAVPAINRRRHISVLLPPRVDSAKLKDQQKWLDRYYEKWQVTIFWGTASEFCRQLRRRMK